MMIHFGGKEAAERLQLCFPGNAKVRNEGRGWYLQAGDGEVGDEPDHLGVVLHLHQFSQLVIAFQPGQQPAELVVIVGV